MESARSARSQVESCPSDAIATTRAARTRDGGERLDRRWWRALGKRQFRSTRRSRPESKQPYGAAECGVLTTLRSTGPVVTPFCTEKRRCVLAREAGAIRWGCKWNCGFRPE